MRVAACAHSAGSTMAASTESRGQQQLDIEQLDLKIARKLKQIAQKSNEIKACQKRLDSFWFWQIGAAATMRKEKIAEELDAHKYTCGTRQGELNDLRVLQRRRKQTSNTKLHFRTFGY